MRPPDLDRARSEKHLAVGEFLKIYNDEIPASFPKATLPLLQEFRKNNEALFKRDSAWSLDLHRKKVMDWLPSRLRIIS